MQRKKEEDGHAERLRICFWNVEGLLNKLGDDDFVSFLNIFNIVCLAETWVGVGKDIKMRGFTVFGKTRKRKGKKGRNPGGLAVCVRDGGLIECEKLNNKVEEVLWLLVKSRNLRFILGVVYLHPVGSVFWRKGVLNEIEEEMQTLQEDLKENRVMLVGDFNSRIGKLNVNADMDDNDELGEWLGRYSYGERKSEDAVVNREGKELINLCERHDLGVLNGVHSLDSIGKFTFLGSMGKSVVDYGIVSRDLWDLVEDFKIGERTESDHMPLLINVNSQSKDTKHDENSGAIEITRMRRFRWSEAGAKQVEEKVQGGRSLVYLTGVRYFLMENKIEEADSLLKDFFYYICEKVGVKVNKPKKGHNNWYDRDCRKAKSRLKWLLRKLRTGDGSLEDYIEAKKMYKQLCEEKKNTWENRWTTDLCEVVENKDDKKFWKMIRRLKGSACRGGDVRPEEWVEHFKHVFKQTEDVYLETFEMREGLEDEGHVVGEITKDEVVLSIKKLKNGKAPG